jgi:GntR family transcriptional regulator/MocR family aminotransferase
MTVQGDEAGLHFLLRLDANLPPETIEQALAEAGIRAAGLWRYKTGPAAETDQNRFVIQYSDLAEADLPRVVKALEELVAV